MSVTNHNGARTAQFKRQARARKNYLKFAKSQGLNISYQEISVTGSATIESAEWITDFCERSRKLSKLKEWQVFIAWVLPFLRSGDRIYKRFEGFYGNDYQSNHVNTLLKTYSQLVFWVEAPIYIIPCADQNEIGVLCKKFKIPRNCVSSCDESRNIKDCNACVKCYRVEEFLSPSGRV